MQDRSFSLTKEIQLLFDNLNLPFAGKEPRAGYYACGKGADGAGVRRGLCAMIFDGNG